MNEKQSLGGQIAVVTGGGRGIGAAISRKLAHMGAEVVICGRNLATLKSTADAIQKEGGSAIAVVCEIEDIHSVQTLADEVKQRLGKIDILVNNAGVGGFDQPLHKLPPAEFDKILNTNLRGVYYMIRSFVPLMIVSGGGHIVNISSLAGKNALPNGACYAASKWGLNGMSYSVAEELRGHNIRVAVVCPGSVDTDLSPHAGKNKAKMLQPEDVAHAVAMLVTQAPQSFVSELLMRPTQKP